MASHNLDDQTPSSAGVGGAYAPSDHVEQRAEDVLAPSEKISSPTTRPVIEALARDIDSHFDGDNTRDPGSPMSSQTPRANPNGEQDAQSPPTSTAAPGVHEGAVPTASNDTMQPRREDHSLLPSTTCEKPEPKAGQSPTVDPPSVYMSWLPEIAASLLAIGFLIAIVVVLFVYENQLLADIHLPRYLSLNGLIAILATLNRVCLAVPLGSSISQEAWIWLASNQTRPRPRSSLRDLILSDAASRGLWGSLVFLFTSPRRYVTTLTVLVSLLSLGISTFVQQLAVYENLPVPPSSAFRAGNIPRSETYDTSAGSSMGPDFDGCYALPRMTAAIFSGLYTTDIAHIDPSCPSANCTYPPTPSLAICGGCVPTKPRLLGCQNKYSCNYTTPSGTNITVPDLRYNDVGNPWFLVQQTGGRHFNASSDSKRAWLYNFDMVGYDYYQPVYGPLPTIRSRECALWYCVNTYDTKVTNTHQNIEVIDTSHTINGTYGAANEYTGLYYIEPPSLSKSSIKTRPKEVYTVSWWAENCIRQQLQASLNGTAEYTPEGAQISTSQYVDRLWYHHQNSTDDMMANLARSMTNALRTLTPSTRPEYNGTTYQLGVRVRWEWITLPAFVVLATLLLLAVVMRRSARVGVGSWKDGPLTLLLFDVDDVIRQTSAASGGKDGGDTNGLKLLEKQVVTLGQNQRDARWFLRSATPEVAS